MAPRKENQPLHKERKIVQASREDIFPPLAGANAPDPYAACGRKASPKSGGNGMKHGESSFVGFHKSAQEGNSTEQCQVPMLSVGEGCITAGNIGMRLLR